MDATDGKALESQNIHESDAVVVAIGANFEALLLCCVQLKELGVKRIIAPSAVGSLKEEFARRDFALPTQFLDFTKSREGSFSEDGRVIHLSLIHI